MAVRIDTQKVEKTASKIDRINTTMSKEFDNLETAIKNLDKTWNGSASRAGIGKFYDIKNRYAEKRSLVISDMTRFMHIQVSDGYEATEKAISSAAKAFK